MFVPFSENAIYFDVSFFFLICTKFLNVDQVSKYILGPLHVYTQRVLDSL